MRILVLLAFSSIVALAACTTTAPEDDPEIPLTAASSAGCVNNPTWAYSAKRGAGLYKANCAYCHGAAGSGQTGQVPALANNAGLSADPDRGIRKLLLTQSSKGRIHGMEFDDMAALLEELSEKDLADTLTYVLSSWGNCAGPIKPARIKAVASSSM